MSVLPTALANVAQRAIRPSAVTPAAPTNSRVRGMSAQISRPSAGLGFNAK